MTVFRLSCVDLIRLRVSQLRKCITGLLVWTCFPGWVLSCIANSHEIVPVLARTLLSKEIRLLASFSLLHFQGVSVAYLGRNHDQKLKVEFLCPYITVIKCCWASGSFTYFSCLFIIWLAVFVVCEIVSMHYCNLDFLLMC